MSMLFSQYETIFPSEDNFSPFMQEWRGRFTGKALCVIFPQNTQEISDIIHIAQNNRLKIIIQGGNTGLVGGQIPQDPEKHILLSMKKMKNIIEYSPLDQSITVESGVVLNDLHQFMDDKPYLFPLELSSGGSAQIGGLISTNAGGTHVLRYGMMKDLLYGLEVVLANGDVIDETHSLIKANRGIDTKSLFCGTEGAYGIITKASLRLFPRPRTTATFLLSFTTVNQAISFLSLLKATVQDNILLYELLPAITFDLMEEFYSLPCPFDKKPTWAVLIDITNYTYDFLEKIFYQFLEKKHIEEVIIAQNKEQEYTLHKIRSCMSEAQKHLGASIKHDISVPIRHIPTLIDQGIKAVHTLLPDSLPVPFGHAGDGNIHFNISQPKHMSAKDFMTYECVINQHIFDIVHSLEGSFSAEHGIGFLRKKQLETYSSPAQNNLRKRLKEALDPNYIFNTHCQP